MSFLGTSALTVFSILTLSTFAGPLGIGRRSGFIHWSLLLGFACKTWLVVLDEAEGLLVEHHKPGLTAGPFGVPFCAILPFRFHDVFLPHPSCVWCDELIRTAGVTRFVSFPLLVSGHARTVKSLSSGFVGN